MSKNTTMPPRRRRLSGDSLQNVSLIASRSGLLGEAQSPYIYVDKMRDSTVLRGFRDLFESSLLFDVTLSVDGKEFQVHRSLVAASSDYFRALFTVDCAEKDQKVVAIKGIDGVSMDLVIKFLYTGQVELQTDTVQNLLSAANLFQLCELKKGCAEFMANKLDVDNCIGIHFFAQAHECETLEFHAWDVITENFEMVSSGSEFLDLSWENVIEIIKYDDIQATEEEVFEAAIKWLQHKPDERQSHIFPVFSNIRFSLIDRHYFYDRVKSNPLLQGETKLQMLFDDVIRYILLRSRWIESDMRLEPRYGADFSRVIVYTSYLDDEKKQVLQLYGQRSDDVTPRPGNVLCDLPNDIENPSVLVTGDNDLYIAGGDGLGSCMYKLNAEDKYSFEEVAPMPIPRKQFCLMQVDNNIFTIGGANHEGNLSSMAKYSEDHDEWEPAASMPKALRCFCAVAYHGKLYVFGGESERSTKKVIRGKMELNKQTFCYDPRDDKWQILAEMSTPRALAGCTIYKNKIYVIGGFGSITESWVKDKSPENCLTSVEIYDPETNSWEDGPELPTALCAMGVVKYYGTIYILGGENDEDVSNSVYFLSDDGKWEHKDEMVMGVTETTIHSCYTVIDVDMDNFVD